MDRVQNWKPGDVAMIRVATGDWEYGLMSDDGEWLCQHKQPRKDWQEVQVLPVAVVEYHDPEQVQRLMDLIAAQPLGCYGATTQTDRWQAALREFANPTPPIEEPTGLGAVVETAHGELYVRDKTTTTVAHWKRARGEEGGQRHRWSDLRVTRVLSEGVPTEADR